MKIAFVGKGGSGKTTTSSLFIKFLVSRSVPIVAIDADINQHLGVALGLSQSQASVIPALGHNIMELKEYVRGNNPLIKSAGAMLKSTPAGEGSRLVAVKGDDPFNQKYSVDAAGARLMVTGPYDEKDLGVNCYHGMVGAAELYLNHVADRPNDYVVMDMTAGADSFASGLFTRFDVTFMVVEPTVKSVAVYNQYKSYAADHDVKICVVGNKIEDEDDVAFLRQAVGDDLLCWIEQSAYVRATEKGRQPDFAMLEPHNLESLRQMLDEIKATKQDWVRFARQGAEFHKRYVERWSGDKSLVEQIDPNFVVSVS